MINVTEWLKGRVNTPFAKTGKALAIQGPPGSGRSVAARLIAREMGQGRSLFMRPGELPRIPQIRGIEHLYLIIVDEAESVHLEHVKQLVSVNRVQAEPLGQSPFMTSFNANFVLTCSDLVPVEHSRRFVIATPMEVFAAIASMNRGVTL